MLALQQGWWKDDLVLSSRFQEEEGEPQALQSSPDPWEARLDHEAAREFEKDLDAEREK